MLVMGNFSKSLSNPELIQSSNKNLHNPLFVTVNISLNSVVLFTQLTTKSFIQID